MEEQTQSNNHKENCLIEALGLTHEWLRKAQTKIESLFLEEKIRDKKELIQKMIEWVKEDDHNYLGEKMFIISEIHSEILSNLAKRMLIEKMFGDSISGLGLEFKNDSDKKMFLTVLKIILKIRFQTKKN